MPKAINFGSFITSTTSYFAGNVWYLNGENSQALRYEKEIRTHDTTVGTTEHKHYVRAGGLTFALVVTGTQTVVRVSGGVTTTSFESISRTSYFHNDHLGSIAAITNEAGAVVERLAYDPWGKRRFVNTQPGQADALDAIVGVRTDRGYTGHEHLDEIGVIHANGRIYDPLIGRFMSADPFIQAAGELQNYNRYSYVLNNPLGLTDPSGYFFKKFFKKFLRPIIAIAVAVYAPYISGYVGLTGPATAAGLAGTGGLSLSLGISSAVASGALGGALSGAILTGNLRGAITGAFTGAAFGGVGDIAPNGIGNVVGHAAVGCVSSVANGGGCSSGALSAGAGSIWSNYGAKFESFAANLTSHAVVGGTASVLGGGKFQNGAVTASFGYLFNCVQHDCIGGESGLTVSSEPQREVQRLLWEETRGKTDWEAGFKASVSDLFKHLPKWLNVDLVTADQQVQIYQRVQFGDEMHQVWREAGKFVRSQPLIGDAQIRWKNEFGWRPAGDVSVIRNWRLDVQGTNIWTLRKDGTQ